MANRATLVAIILIVAVIGNLAVLYFVEEPMARLSLGFLLLAIIVWSSSRLGLVEMVTQSPAERVRKRRFTLLRAQVQQLLDEIRRMNWMAVDADRGFRSREQALREMDQIESRLKGLIAEIRNTAGQLSPETGEASAGGEVRVANEQIVHS
jgi:hypothetical protein